MDLAATTTWAPPEAMDKMTTARSTTHADPEGGTREPLTGERREGRRGMVRSRVIAGPHRGDEWEKGVAEEDPGDPGSSEGQYEELKDPKVVETTDPGRHEGERCRVVDEGEDCGDHGEMDELIRHEAERRLVEARSSLRASLAKS